MELEQAFIVEGLLLLHVHKLLQVCLCVTRILHTMHSGIPWFLQVLGWWDQKLHFGSGST